MVGLIVGDGAIRASGASMDERDVAADCGGNARARRQRAPNHCRDALSLIAASIIAFGMAGAAAAGDHKHAPAKHASGPSKKTAKTEHGSHKGHATPESKRSDAKHAEAKRGGAKRADTKHGAGGRHNRSEER